MDFRCDSVFQAYCYGHSCNVLFNEGRQRHSASLVTISPRSARIYIDDTSALPCEGDCASLSPLFLQGVQVDDIQARVETVNGKELHLFFNAPLPMTGSRLCQLTRR